MPDNIAIPAPTAITETPVARRSDTQIVFLFLRRLIPVWPQALLALLLQFSLTTLALLPAWLQKGFVDYAIPRRDVNLFLLIFIGIVTLSLTEHIVGLARGVIARYIDLRVRLALRRDFYAHLQRLSPMFHSRRGVGEHMYRASDDVNAVIHLITGIVPGAILRVYEFALVVALLSVLSPEVALILVLYCGPYALLVDWFATQVRYRDAIMREMRETREAGLQEGLAGVATVQTFGRRRFEMWRLNHLTTRAFRAGASKWWFQEMFQGKTVGTLLPWLKEQALRVYFLQKVIRGELTYGATFPILDLTGRITGPILGLVNMVQEVRLLMVPARRLLQTLDVSPAVTERPGAVRLPRLRGAVRFENVGFVYEDGRQAVTGVSGEIAPGRFVAIVGESGAGKTTLGSLLLRLFDPTEGAIQVEGYDLRDVRLEAYREQIGVVMQETHLFLGTLRENLLFASPDAAEEEMLTALDGAGLSDFVAALPYGLDTDLAEGTRLSVGQRQRIGIARALLRDPALLLLDEPTASLDSRTEAAVWATLRKASQGRTTILITHRLSTARDADEIWVMEAGRIVERGSHTELLARKQAYHRLFRLYRGNEEGQP